MATQDSTATQRPAEPGERCTCGRPATVVFLTSTFGPVPWCGSSDGAQPAHTQVALAFHIPTDAATAPAPALTVADVVDLLAAVNEALEGRDPAAIEWTASVLEAFLAGRQDAVFASRFLRAQAARLRQA